MWLPMCGFIARLVEHRIGIAEVTSLNPVEALIIFRLLYYNCLNWKFTAKITYHLHIYPQFIYESFHIHYIKKVLIAHLKFSMRLILHMIKKNLKKKMKVKNAVKYRNSVLK